MRKNRTARFIFNGALLAVMAVLGVTAYQVSNKQEHIQEVLPLESTHEDHHVIQLFQRFPELWQRQEPAWLRQIWTKCLIQEFWMRKL